MNIQGKSGGGSFSNQNEESGPQKVPSSYYTNVFLNLFGAVLTNRYPFVTDIEDIDPEELRQIAKLTAMCTPILVTTWNEALGSTGKTQRRFDPEAKSRSAA